MVRRLRLSLQRESLDFGFEVNITYMYDEVDCEVHDPLA